MVIVQTVAVDQAKPDRFAEANHVGMCFRSPANPPVAIVLSISTIKAARNEMQKCVCIVKTLITRVRYEH